MIIATGDIDYLGSRLSDEENFKKMMISGDSSGWHVSTWTEQQEERLNLLRELIKYKKLYLKVEQELEELKEGR